METIKNEIKQWAYFIGSRFLQLIIIFVLLLFSWYFTEGGGQEEWPFTFIVFTFVILSDLQVKNRNWYGLPQ